MYCTYERGRIGLNGDWKIVFSVEGGLDDNLNNLYNFACCLRCYCCRVTIRRQPEQLEQLCLLCPLLLLSCILFDYTLNNLYNFAFCLRCYCCRVIIRRQPEQLVQHCLLSPLFMLSCILFDGPVAQSSSFWHTHRDANLVGRHCFMLRYTEVFPIKKDVHTGVGTHVLKELFV